jgi:hypothetical protein
MYQLLNPTTNQVWVTMDPDMDGIRNNYDEALEFLKYNFRLHYEKRLPFGLYQHAAQYIAWTPEMNVRRTEIMNEFIRWTLTEFPQGDVWYVTNTQLLEWMLQPVPKSQVGTQLLSCLVPDPKPEMTEICDGIDNDGDGEIDEGLLLTCYYGDSIFRTCYGCPETLPSPDVPVSAFTTPQKRIRIPEEGCLLTSTWDPVSGLCVQGTKRVLAGALKTRNKNLVPPNVRTAVDSSILGNATTVTNGTNDATVTNKTSGGGMGLEEGLRSGRFWMVVEMMVLLVLGAVVAIGF